MTSAEFEKRLYDIVRLSQAEVKAKTIDETLGSASSRRRVIFALLDWYKAEHADG